jgi:ERCC4-type nuclease
MCQKIVTGQEPIYPPGFTPLSDAEFRSLEENAVDPYLDKMSKRSGAHAILMAFHHGSIEATVTRERICQTVRDLDLCDEPMDANFHQGRMYGAWKAKDTLIKHGFLLEYKAGARYTDRGFRSNGAHTYSITESGKKAIRYLLKKWPDTETCARAGFRWNGSLGGGGGTPSLTGFAAHSSASPFPSLAFASSAKTTKHSDVDERELRNWLATAPAYSQKSWKIGKDRRKYLHRLCDQMMSENPGLVLQHESSGEVRGRELVITLKAKPTDETFLKPPPKTVTPLRLESDMLGLANKTSFTGASLLPFRELFPEPNSSGMRLGGSSDPIQVGMSARDAAAMAAMDRMESTAKKRKRTASSTVALSHTKHMKKQDVIELFDDSDDDEFSNKKPAAQQRKDISDAAHDFQPGEEVFVMTLSGRAQGPFKISRVHTSGHVTVKETLGRETKYNVKDVSPCFNAFDFDDAASGTRRVSPHADVIEIDGTKKSPKRLQMEDVIEIDNDGTIDLSGSPPRRSTPVPRRTVTILIDSRERSRNAAPRELRTGLQEQLRVGTLHDVWMSQKHDGIVMERTLSCGDFAFEASTGGRCSRLSVVVERKLIGDLVHRSARGDHWNQCQRMRDNYDQAIMLIENDTTLASRFEAYGGLGVESNPSHHAIENVADVFRFIGRAVLASRNIKFLQTQNQQGTFRSIGALALMAAKSSKVGCDAPASTPAAVSEQEKLKNRLTDGGIDWRVANAIAKEIGSVTALEGLFAVCSTERARNMVVLPIIAKIPERQELGCLRSWSTAVSHAICNTPQGRSKARGTIEEIGEIFGGQLPCDRATLAKYVYEEASKDAVIEQCLQEGNSLTPLLDRKVSIDLSEKFEGCFPARTGDAFYHCSTKSQSAAAIMRTFCGDLVSDALHIYVVEGSNLLNLVVTTMIQASEAADYVSMARDVSKQLHKSFSSSGHPNIDRHVIIVRGLHYALLAASKTSSYRNQTKVLCEMVLASLMLDFDYVVLQGIRKKEDEVHMILQQLALACFHYQYLTKEGE